MPNGAPAATACGAVRLANLLAVLRAFGETGLFGERHGTGSPWVLALHGWRRDHRDFTSMLTEPDLIDSLAVDLPGFGSTPPPPLPWSSLDYAGALAELLGEMDPHVVVLGHSFGGRVAVHLARLCPEQVAGLVLSGVPLFRPSGVRARPKLRYRAARRMAGTGLLSEQALERYRQRYGSADYRASTGVMREILVKLLAEEYGDPLSAVSCPVELVWGEADATAPLEVANRAAELLGPGARLTVVPGGGHLLPISAPQELRSAVLRLRPAQRRS
ncbi:MAG: alpha/beta fold hydrolase [Acidimicrobiales bacterium]